MDWFICYAIYVYTFFYLVTSGPLRYEATSLYFPLSTCPSFSSNWASLGQYEDNIFQWEEGQVKKWLFFLYKPTARPCDTINQIDFVSRWRISGPGLCGCSLCTDLLVKGKHIVNYMWFILWRHSIYPLSLLNWGQKPDCITIVPYTYYK